MKYLVIYLLFCWSFSASSQNYRPFQRDVPHFFYHDQYSIKGIKIDSLNVVGTDTVFYNFFSIDENHFDTNGCINVFGPSWIGRGIIQKSDSLTIILNYDNDTIKIRPLDGIGSSWKMFIRANGNYIKANINNVNTLIIDNILDSIKTITLAEFNANNVPVNSLLNGSKIILSKDHGIYKLFSFRDFPSDTNSFVLNDDLQLNTGNVYDFEVGDSLLYEFQSGTLPFGIYNYKKIIVNGKNYSTFHDTVFYSFSTQTVTNQIFFDSTGGHLVSSVSNSTDSAYYTDLSMPLTNLMPEETDTSSNPFFIGRNLPPQGSAGRYNYRLDYYFCDRLTLETRSGDYLPNGNGCYPGPFEPFVQISSFSKGLGRTKIIEAGCGICGYVSNIYELIAYRKINQSCGNFEIISSSGNFNSEINKPKIYPNPIYSTGYFYVDLNNHKNSLFEIYNLTGIKIISQRLSEKITLIDASQLNSGCYFYKIFYQDNTFVSGKLIR